MEKNPRETILKGGFDKAVRFINSTIKVNEELLHDLEHVHELAQEDENGGFSDIFNDPQFRRSFLNLKEKEVKAAVAQGPPEVIVYLPWDFKRTSKQYIAPY